MERWSSRTYAAVAVALGGVLLVALASAGPEAWAASQLLVTALAALTLVAGHVAGPVATLLSAQVAPVLLTVDPPLLRGRATDPVHHPLAPRAPGRR